MNALIASLFGLLCVINVLSAIAFYRMGRRVNCGFAVLLAVISTLVAAAHILKP